jgi:hypothetical protein
MPWHISSSRTNLPRRVGEVLADVGVGGEEGGLAEDAAALAVRREVEALPTLAELRGVGDQAVERGERAVDEGVGGVEDVAEVAVDGEGDVVDQREGLLAHRGGEGGGELRVDRRVLGEVLDGAQARTSA